MLIPFVEPSPSQRLGHLYFVKILSLLWLVKVHSNMVLHVTILGFNLWPQECRFLLWNLSQAYDLDPYFFLRIWASCGLLQMHLRMVLHKTILGLKPQSPNFHTKCNRTSISIFFSIFMKFSPLHLYENFTQTRTVLYMGSTLNLRIYIPSANKLQFQFLLLFSIFMNFSPLRLYRFSPHNSPMED
jgi:hypothetical protein